MCFTMFYSYQTFSGLHSKAEVINVVYRTFWGLVLSSFNLVLFPVSVSLYPVSSQAFPRAWIILPYLSSIRWDVMKWHGSLWRLCWCHSWVSFPRVRTAPLVTCLLPFLPSGTLALCHPFLRSKAPSAMLNISLSNIHTKSTEDRKIALLPPSWSFW